MAWLDKTVFFARLRDTLYRDALPQRVVDGLNFLIDRKPAGWSDDWFAYALATAYHETAHTMQPIREKGGPAYFRRYEGRADLGNRNPGDGVKFHGRGYVQITGRRNYTDWSDRLKINMIDRPDNAMKPDVAVRILFEGMERGTFTGKSLRSYTSGEFDPVNARRIINGMDKAKLIAGYHAEFLAAIRDARSMRPTAPEVEAARPTGKPAARSTTNIAAGAAAAITAVNAANEAVKPIRDAADAGKGLADTITSLMATPAIVVAILVIGAAVWIIRERLKKAREDGI
jgi:putative chitinase